MPLTPEAIEAEADCLSRVCADTDRCASLDDPEIIELAAREKSGLIETLGGWRKLIGPVEVPVASDENELWAKMQEKGLESLGRSVICGYDRWLRYGGKMPCAEDGCQINHFVRVVDSNGLSIGARYYNPNTIELYTQYLKVVGATNSNFISLAPGGKPPRGGQRLVPWIKQLLENRLKALDAALVWLEGLTDEESTALAWYTGYSKQELCRNQHGHRGAVAQWLTDLDKFSTLLGERTEGKTQKLWGIVSASPATFFKLSTGWRCDAKSDTARTCYRVGGEYENSIAVLSSSPQTFAMTLWTQEPALNDAEDCEGQPYARMWGKLDDARKWWLFSNVYGGNKQAARAVAEKLLDQMLDQPEDRVLRHGDCGYGIRPRALYTNEDARTGYVDGCQWVSDALRWKQLFEMGDEQMRCDLCSGHMDVDDAYGCEECGRTVCSGCLGESTLACGCETDRTLCYRCSDSVHSHCDCGFTICNSCERCMTCQEELDAAEDETEDEPEAEEVAEEQEPERVGPNDSATTWVTLPDGLFTTTGRISVANETQQFYGRSLFDDALDAQLASVTIPDPPISRQALWGSGPGALPYLLPTHNCSCPRCSTERAQIEAEAHRLNETGGAT